MLYIEPDSTDAAFHFAVEDYCMQRLATPILMFWQTGRCAMLGRNQVADAEIDRNAAKELSVQIVRRSSGGGTIYTDDGTLLFTLICRFHPGDDARDLERRLLAGPMIDILNQMEIPAELQGRNDILVAGRKISGLAQRIQGDRLCSHGSLLYDADLSILERILKVDAGKIRSKAIPSVRSRVANVRESYGDRPMKEFLSELKSRWFHAREIESYRFQQNELDLIEDIRRKKYGHPEWTYGKSPPFSLRRDKRFPMGRVEALLDVENGRIRSCRIHGDFLGLCEIEPLESLLTGHEFRLESIRAALEGFDVGPYLGGVTADELLDCLFGTATTGCSS